MKSIYNLLNTNLLGTAISHYGEDAQINKAVEEMAELTHVIMRYNISHTITDNFIEELADVIIMVEQLQHILYNRNKDNILRLEEYIYSKQLRLAHRIDYKEDVGSDDKG